MAALISEKEREPPALREDVVVVVEMAARLDGAAWLETPVRRAARSARQAANQAPAHLFTAAKKGAEAKVKATVIGLGACWNALAGRPFVVEGERGQQQ